MSYIGNVSVDGTTHLVGSTLYGTCTTAASTAIKDVTLSNFDLILEGVTIHVKFSYTNGATNPRLRINSSNANHPIYRYGTTPVGLDAKTSWHPGEVVSLTYSGGAWYLNDARDIPTITSKSVVGYSNLTINNGTAPSFSISNNTLNLSTGTMTTVDKGNAESVGSSSDS